MTTDNGETRAIMLLGLTYDQANFLITEARSQGIGPSAVARGIFEAELRRRRKTVSRNVGQSGPRQSKASRSGVREDLTDLK